jgi:hypothetical protein
VAEDDNQRVSALLDRMERFVRGEDCSLAAANFIEGEIAALFPDDDEFEDLIHLLALYRPEGGPYLWDEATARPQMAHWCGVLRNR